MKNASWKWPAFLSRLGMIPTQKRIEANSTWTPRGTYFQKTWSGANITAFSSPATWPIAFTNRPLPLREWVVLRHCRRRNILAGPRAEFRLPNADCRIREGCSHSGSKGANEAVRITRHENGRRTPSHNSRTHDRKTDYSKCNISGRQLSGGLPSSLASRIYCEDR